MQPPYLGHRTKRCQRNYMKKSVSRAYMAYAAMGTAIIGLFTIQNQKFETSTALQNKKLEATNTQIAILLSRIGTDRLTSSGSGGGNGYAGQQTVQQKPTVVVVT